MKFEGGFQGRTNKLVDGCYSFWQGALFPLLHFLLAKSGRLLPFTVVIDNDLIVHSPKINIAKR
jgi:prenyltransferase beta subunit